MAKILIIDDSWLTRRGLTNMITSLTHGVVEAENGKEGLALIETEIPDCVFLDLLMPEMDGYQVLETLKQNGSNTPVIICSADIQETAKEKCLTLGAVGFLNKPPKELEIAAAIERVLGN